MHSNLASPSIPLSELAAAFVRRGNKLLIDGRWIPSASGKTFPTCDPASEELITECAEGDAEDINRAVSAARRCLRSGSVEANDAAERGRLVWRIGDLILQHGDELAELEALDNGKVKGVARAVDVPLCADAFHYMAGWATKIAARLFRFRCPTCRARSFTRSPPASPSA
jgi:phenylacetaldehyde dehydrogenase